MTKILDGGLSTELETLGAAIEGSLWTGRALLDDPAIIERAHRNFIAAGAELVITSSYQLSRRGFNEIGLTSEKADAALAQSVEVARRATEGTSALVAASVGPFGAVLHDGSEYRGNYGLSEDELYQFHIERIQVLEAAGPDILLAETIPDLTEAKALTRALQHSKLPVWISFSVADGEHLWSGAKIQDAIRSIAEIPNLQAIGFNCVNPDLVAELVETARQVSDIAIAVYPNKGGVWNSELGEWDSQKVKSLDEYWPEWKDLNLTYVGGCCGSNSHDISKLAQAVSNY
jgi:homocysteine S-methyltransferase